MDNFNGDLIKSINEQRKPPPGLSFYKSLQHVVLSREFVRFAVYGQETRLIMLYLANVMTSDEMLIPTLIQVLIMSYLLYSCAKNRDSNIEKRHPGCHSHMQ